VEFLDQDNIRSVCGGTWLARPLGPDRPALTGVSTDSRTLKPGQIFFALKGEHHDGHRYIQQAAKAGAAMAVIDRAEAAPQLLLDELPRGFSLLHCANASTALLRLAGAYRKSLETTKVIAVGGSNGKTTTTRMIQAILSRSLRGSASPKSFNNAVGVPLTILGAKRGDQFLVCEVGTNAPGEIATLAEVVQPDIAVITSIGREHLEGLASLEGVVHEEASLLSTIRPGGLAVVTADAPPSVTRTLQDLSRQAHSAGRALLRVGLAYDADLRVSDFEHTPDGSRFCINDRWWIQTPLLGRHNAANAASASAVARRLGIDWPQIADALAQVRPAEMRLERVDASGVRFLNDAYNANPESMLAALRVFEECFAAGAARRIVVLADMLEMGHAGEDAHAEIADALAQSKGIDLAVLVGPLMRHAAARLAQSWDPGRFVAFAHSSPAELAQIASMLRPGDAVLLKGSRRNALERIIRELTPGARETVGHVA
jgi:UDP-N-acetylmuramoyl-tripeptide--D-alanyl-D-alanine ligase